jgi:hypothetical protein
MASMHCYEDAKHTSKKFLILCGYKSPLPLHPYKTALYVLGKSIYKNYILYSIYVILTNPYLRLTFQTNFNKMQYGYVQKR